MGRRSSKIATKKNKEDKARGKLYGRIGKQIVAACAPSSPLLVSQLRPRGRCACNCSIVPANAAPSRSHEQRSVKAGGPSENSNSRLAAVLDQARLNNIPKARAFCLSCFHAFPCTAHGRRRRSRAQSTQHAQ